MKKVRIAPSILAWDLSDLGVAAELAEKGGADQLHLDVIDGHFAPNITFGPGTVKSLRRKCDLPFDTHLMIDNPEKYVSKFIDAGSDIVSVHAEVLDAERFDKIHSAVAREGKSLGLAIKPSTDLPMWAVDRLDKLSAILVMTVNPGFSGQAMDMSVMPKLERLHRLVEDRGSRVDLEIDGGVEQENVGEVVTRGGSVLVAGAGVYAKKDPAMAMKQLREQALKAVAVA